VEKPLRPIATAEEKRRGWSWRLQDEELKSSSIPELNLLKAAQLNTSRLVVS